MSRDVCGICWCPIDNEGCGCVPKQSKAMRLAEELEQYATSAIEKEVAREVRDLIRESEALREDMQRFREDAHCERETRRQLERHVEALRAENELLHTRCQQAYTVGRESGREDNETLLRQALEALEYCRSGEDCHPTLTSEAIDALKERLK